MVPQCNLKVMLSELVHCIALYCNQPCRSRGCCRGSRGCHTCAPWHLQIWADQLTLLNQKGQIMPKITTGNPLTFQTFLQPWRCNAISASISSNVLHQMMLTSKLILDNEVAAFGESLGLISYMHLTTISVVVRI
jgi:hypothetical protein